MYSGMTYTYPYLSAVKESNIRKILFRSFTGAPMTVILANAFIYSEIPIQRQRCAGKQAYYYSRSER
jgi:hypothetical protein